MPQSASQTLPDSSRTLPDSPSSSRNPSAPSDPSAMFCSDSVAAEGGPAGSAAGFVATRLPGSAGDSGAPSVTAMSSFSSSSPSGSIRGACASLLCGTLAAIVCARARGRKAWPCARTAAVRPSPNAPRRASSCAAPVTSRSASVRALEASSVVSFAALCSALTAETSGSSGCSRGGTATDVGAAVEAPSAAGDPSPSCSFSGGWTRTSGRSQPAAATMAETCSLNSASSAGASGRAATALRACCADSALARSPKAFATARSAPPSERRDSASARCACSARAADALICDSRTATRISPSAASACAAASSASADPFSPSTSPIFAARFRACRAAESCASTSAAVLPSSPAAVIALMCSAASTTACSSSSETRA
mmetsp:Transcript_44257/g.103803  ORF Transcript_44257/g.103803 Transcript_44257/m.103803 type:complete len:372 (-) Transcript_44257:1987-3102(-)